MPDSIETRQNFLKGINRRTSRNSAIDPRFFWALQNARILSRGNTGQVERIKGFTKFNVGTTVYSKTLAMETFNEFFIVFYESAAIANEFNIDVIDTSGSVVFTGSYTAQATTEGTLVVSDENIFVSPHNKVLYFKQGNWTLTDYISKIGEITGVSLVDNSIAGQGTIIVTSGGTSFGGTKAGGTIEILKNNTPVGKTDTFQVSVDGNTTGNITVSYKDNVYDIRDKIYNALIAVTAITNDWDITKSVGTTLTFPITGLTIAFPATVGIDAKNVGSIWNGKDISIINSDFNIAVGGGGKNDLTNFDFSEAVINTTIKIFPIQGGSDVNSNLGPLYFYFFAQNITVVTENIIASDTYSVIGGKINTALNNNTLFASRYSTSVNDTGLQYEITMNAVRGGEDLNTKINFYMLPEGFEARQDPNDFFGMTVTPITGGQESSSVGTLDNFTDYWYRVRYRFKEGHVTNASFPVYVFSDVAESIQLTVDTSLLDIDGNRAQLEVFRKQGEGDFFFIERISPSADSTVVTDNGKFDKSSIEEKSNIWNKSHNAHAIIDNRYVRGGIEYFNEQYSGEANLTITQADSADEHELPVESEVSVYVKPQYEDGTLGYHSLIGTQTVTQTGKKLRISQSGLLTNPDKTIKRLGFYGNYKPKPDKNSFRFNTMELANPNIPTIADQTLFPGRTRILFGFKYIELKGENSFIRFRANGWQKDIDKEYTNGFIRTFSGPVELSGGHPRKIEVTIFGIDFTYHRIYVEEDAEIVSSDYNSIYKLDCYEALVDAVKTRQLRLQFGLESSVNNSRIQPLAGNSAITQIAKDLKDDILSQQVLVTNIIDESSQYPDVNFEASNTMWGPLDSRIYLELEDSIFDEIENQNITDYTIQRRFNMETENPMPFQLLGFTLDSVSTLNESVVEYNTDGGAERSLDGNIYYAYDWNESIYNLTNKLDLENEDRLIFLGSKKNEISAIEDLPVTGFQDIDTDKLNFVYTNDFNLYDQLVEKEDINTERTLFQTQLIWSGRILSGTRYSEKRNISPENFFILPAKNGRIVYMETLQGRLYVFCTYGVAVCLIGETIARQKSGQVVVTDSSFISSYYWLFEKLDEVKHDTVLKHGNRIYFCDGRDIYQIGRESGNISQGALPLDADHSYSATIDDQNDEYRLSDLTDGVTWVYNYEGQQFYGPFTYVAKQGENLKKQVVSVVGDNIVQFGQGNDFNGIPFDTVIASVANDTNESFRDKAFRKFYIETENDSTTVFRYGKDFTSFLSVNLMNMITKNGYKYQGIAPSEKNSKVIYWELESRDAGFLLNDLSFIYKPKSRR